jgi:hypothetical protein
MLDTIIAWVLSFLASIAPNVGAFVVMCLLDLGLGVSVAIKTKTFAWSRVGDFYLTQVLSYFMGWFAFALCGSLLANNLDVLGEYKIYVSTGWIWATWLLLAAQLFSSIGSNFKALYGKDLAPTVLFEDEGKTDVIRN